MDWVLGVDIEQQTLPAVNVDIVAMTVGTIAVDIVAQTVGNIAIDIAAQSFANLTVDIAAQSLGNIAIDIAAQSVGNINIDVAAQTVDLNIRTAGGVNIVIDQLTQAAYLERRDDLDNRGAVITWESVTGNTRRGKFYPRGARGFLYGIGVHCQDTAAAGGTIAVYLAPYVGAGYLYTANVVVPPGVGPGWIVATFNVMWEYDSMFIWAVSSVVAVQFGYDVGTPYDAFTSADAGVTWASVARRYWFIAHMTGLTVGDIPVSGTLNVIILPNVQSYMDLIVKVDPDDIDGGTTVDLLPTIYGMGKLTHLQGSFEKSAGAVPPTNMFLGIVIDGTTFEISVWEMLASQAGVVLTTSPLSMAKIDNTEQLYAWAFNKDMPFRQSLRIYARNSAAAGNIFEALVLIGYELIR